MRAIWCYTFREKLVDAKSRKGLCFKLSEVSIKYFFFVVLLTETGIILKIKLKLLLVVNLVRC